MKRFSRQDWLNLILLAAIAWISRYLLSGGFGLYEDDFTRVPNGIGLSWHGLGEYWLYMARVYYANRPLHDLLITSFSMLGWRLHQLTGVYLLGYLLWLLNIALFYILLWRVAGRSLALAASLAYVVFSADTTQAYLTMSLGGQPSITLVLVAFHAYLSRKAWLSYLLVWPVIMFAYETPFLVFLATPLLPQRETLRDYWKPFAKNAIILAVLFLSSFLVRFRQTGSGEFNGGYPAAIKLALLHMLQGPVISLGTYVLRPIQTLQQLDWQILAVILVVLGLGIYLVAQIRVDENLSFRVPGSGLRLQQRLSMLPPAAQQLVRLLLAGVLMLVAAYPITFTTRVWAISGRTTRGHMAAVPGAALIIGCLILFFFAWMTAHGWRKLAIFIIAAEVALMAGFGLTIQRDYVLAWQNQREFWTQILPLISDASPGDVVLVTPNNLPQTLQIGAVTWNISRTLDGILQFPAEL